MVVPGHESFWDELSISAHQYCVCIYPKHQTAASITYNMSIDPHQRPRYILTSIYLGLWCWLWGLTCFNSASHGRILFLATCKAVRMELLKTNVRHLSQSLGVFGSHIFSACTLHIDFSSHPKGEHHWAKVGAFYHITRYSKQRTILDPHTEVTWKHLHVNSFGFYRKHLCHSERLNSSGRSHHISQRHLSLETNETINWRRRVLTVMVITDYGAFASVQLEKSPFAESVFASSGYPNGPIVKKGEAINYKLGSVHKSFPRKPL